MASKKIHVQILENHWPLLFSFDDPKPLMIDIGKVILSLTDNSEHTEIKRAINYYTRRLKYIHCLARGGDRFDLDGQASGIVTKEQVLQAKLAISANLEKRPEKIKNKLKHQKEMERAAENKRIKSLIVEKPKKVESPTIIVKSKTIISAPKKTKSSTIIIKKKRTIVIPTE